MVGLGESGPGKLSGSLGNCRELQMLSMAAAKGKYEGVADNKADNTERNGVTKGLIY